MTNSPHSNPGGEEITVINLSQPINQFFSFFSYSLPFPTSGLWVLCEHIGRLQLSFGPVYQGLFLTPTLVTGGSGSGCTKLAVPFITVWVLR